MTTKNIYDLLLSVKTMKTKQVLRATINWSIVGLALLVFAACYYFIRSAFTPKVGTTYIYNYYSEKPLK